MKFYSDQELFDHILMLTIIGLMNLNMVDEEDFYSRISCLAWNCNDFIVGNTYFIVDEIPLPTS